MSNEKIKVGISVGDLNGIGTEVILKTFEESMMLDLCTPVIFASTKTLSFIKKHFDFQQLFYGINHPKDALEGKINVVNLWKETPEIEFGKADFEIGKLAFQSLREATKALKEGTIDVLVTAPINKHTIHSEEFNFPGHTDYLAKELAGDSLMLMVSENLRVGLLTDHVPVSEVANHLNEELIKKKIRLLIHSLQTDFGISKPKIALLGINPHCGDNGVIGQEDDTILIPVIQQFKSDKILIYGPYAADSFFGSGNYKNFDGILAAYHDQGLVPFKTLAFGGGVNFTAGLSHIRTSPDHGTGFDIAGKNLADPGSFRQAVYTAIDVFRNRSNHQTDTQNPLKKLSKNTSERYNP
ncbi:MAG: 4-hydroxythreonine-4-phosphate dehydrogenase PdxA [Bacteroidetes bacterium HGW-Bacteroidetes-13]|nr:MAG: 4-hydroxythreonine-4-phosphate dehydrogenase PdxA [Bacteroidetes bacterium HGW-Bacteroidetes-13]